MEYGMNERLMTAGEVAKIFRVDPKTVTRWANQGRLRSVKTPGGHRRYFETQVKELLEQRTNREETASR